MTHTLNFKQDKPFRDLLINTFMTKEKMKIPYEDKYTKEKGFWLVKDEGIYLMNAFKCKQAKPIVTYAEGYSPEDDDEDDLWDRTHEVSGDDFAEFVPLSKEQYEYLLFNLNAYFQIKLSKTKLEMNIID